MMDKIFTDLETFMIDVGYDRIFRVSEKRTDGDLAQYIDESRYIRGAYVLIKIIEVVELPDKDVLIGFKEVSDLSDLDTEEYENLPIIYKKLSQLDLAFYPDDMKNENRKD